MWKLAYILVPNADSGMYFHTGASKKVKRKFFSFYFEDKSRKFYLLDNHSRNSALRKLLRCHRFDSWSEREKKILDQKMSRMRVADSTEVQSKRPLTFCAKLGLLVLLVSAWLASLLSLRSSTMAFANASATCRSVGVSGLLALPMRVAVCR